MAGRNAKGLLSQQTQTTFGIRSTLQHRQHHLYKIQSICKTQAATCFHLCLGMNINSAQLEIPHHAEKNSKQHIAQNIAICLPVLIATMNNQLPATLHIYP